MFACTTSSGDEVVLKLAGTREEARTEAAASGIGSDTAAAVKLIDTNFQHAALLIGRMREEIGFAAADERTAPHHSSPRLRIRMQNGFVHARCSVR